MTAAASRLLLVEVFVRFVLFLTGLVYLCKVNCSVFFLFFCVCLFLLAAVRLFPIISVVHHTVHLT